MTRLDPTPFAADAALSVVWDALPEARVAGGAVRDSLAGRPVSDIDLATPRPPQDVTAALSRAGVRVVPTGVTHGTVTAVVQGRGFEITTLRHDVETDGRHAVVAFTDDWQADASRRDFTINAMSMTRDGTVYDYFGGVADLAAGRVRFVGDAVARIHEDYLRILRYFRFYGRYASQPPDADTVAALVEGIPGLARLSVERVWAELRLILGADDPAASVALMVRLGIWQAVLPEATPVERLAGLPADPILRLAAMLSGDPLALALRLKLSNHDRDRLVRLAATPSVRAEDDDATLRRLLADHRTEDLIDRVWLDGGPAALRQRLAAMPRPVFPLVGRHVRALGVSQGPRVGELLRDVRQWWLDGGCVADATACRAELARRACAAG
ncbi:CCA tRNA nucleotidyltransferase [Rhodopila globiformis]|uniref:CCA tRNA nucleotidyltransferase n=1 Tax=Rhodopila globiformis TaxID=1071 RepID=UPI001EFDE45D|nr:CCA tRNA nucleotidyltransferase [Rhodopila globiformis]